MVHLFPIVGESSSVEKELKTTTAANAVYQDKTNILFSVRFIHPDYSILYSKPYEWYAYKMFLWLVGWPLSGQLAIIYDVDEVFLSKKEGKGIARQLCHLLSASLLNKIKIGKIQLGGTWPKPKGTGIKTKSKCLVNNLIRKTQCNKTWWRKKSAVQK